MGLIPHTIKMNRASCSSFPGGQQYYGTVLECIQCFCGLYVVLSFSLFSLKLSASLPLSLIEIIYKYRWRWTFNRDFISHKPYKKKCDMVMLFFAGYKQTSYSPESINTAFKTENGEIRPEARSSWPLFPEETQSGISGVLYGESWMRNTWVPWDARPHLPG